ncbi:hypothetical protein ACLBW2_11565 [Enterobacteriaceae bacterium C23F]
MSNIKDLNFDEIALVSGGEGHGTEVNRERQEARNSGGLIGGSARKPNVPNYIYSDPAVKKCGDAVFGGLIEGIPGGPVSMGWNVAKGAIDGQCLSGSSNGNNNGGNAGSSNCSGNGAAGTCNR